jgi:hypothetical protein
VRERERERAIGASACAAVFNDCDNAQHYRSQQLRDMYDMRVLVLPPAAVGLVRRPVHPPAPLRLGAAHGLGEVSRSRAERLDAGGSGPNSDSDCDCQGGGRARD